MSEKQVAVETKKQNIHSYVGKNILGNLVVDENGKLIDIRLLKNETIQGGGKWSVEQKVFFSSTTISTILEIKEIIDDMVSKIKE